MAKVTARQLEKFVNVANRYLDRCRTCSEPAESQNPQIIGPHDHRIEKRHKFVPPKETKFTYALGRMLSKTETTVKKVADKLDIIAVKHARTDPPDDENGELLRDAQNRLRFSKKGQVACFEAQQNFLDEKEIEVEPHFVKSVPDDVTQDGLSALEFFIIDSDTLKAIREQREGALQDEGEAEAKDEPGASAAPNGDSQVVSS